MKLYVCMMNWWGDSHTMNIGLITTDEVKARAWCDKIEPEGEENDYNKWASYYEHDLEEDLLEFCDWSDSFDVSLKSPKYSQVKDEF